MYIIFLGNAKLKLLLDLQVIFSNQSKDVKMKNILEQYAFYYPNTKTNPDMSNYSYNEEKGYWINKKTDIVLIKEQDGPQPQSKKCDHETGEDRKGE